MTRLSQNEPVSAQSVQAAPPTPQAALSVPVTHVLPSQQPDAQFAAEQAGAWQTPDWQTRLCAEQFAHVSPPVPHAAFCVPVSQKSPTQQPAQLARPHWLVESMHVPAGSQIWFLPQALHAAPLAPQAAAVVVVTHWLPTQHPAQLSGPHVAGVWQVRSFPWPSATQVWRPPHAAQSWPFFPHAVESLPVTQAPVAVQQPPQFVGPHAETPEQAPPTPVCVRHDCPVAHVAHVSPPSPQAAGVVPGKHLSSTQQPAQFSGVQRDVPHARELGSQERPSVWQSAHWAPDCPQAAGSFPARQRRRPSSTVQQPEHVVALHEASSRPHTRDVVHRL